MSEELATLERALERGIITPEEYEDARNRLLEGTDVCDD